MSEISEQENEVNRLESSSSRSSSSSVSLRSEKSDAESLKEIKKNQAVAEDYSGNSQKLNVDDKNSNFKARTPLKTRESPKLQQTNKEITSPTNFESQATEPKQLFKKVQITDDNMKEMKQTSGRTSRNTPDSDANLIEHVSSELHVIRNRKACSAPARARNLFAQSSNLKFLQKECDKLERKMRKSAKTNLATRPKVTPYKPFTWNSLAPYYNTDPLRYIINMPVPVRRGYNSRPTACGLVDPAESWKMDHCVTPITPSRPELFRQHYATRRTKSAMPRVTYDKSILSPSYPKVTATTYSILAETHGGEFSTNRHKSSKKN